MPRPIIPELTLLESNNTIYPQPGAHSPTPIRALLERLCLPLERVPLPLERPLNRSALLELAPDREALLMGGGSAEELRTALKIRIPRGCTDAQWLSQVQTRARLQVNAKLLQASSFNLKDNTNTPSLSRKESRYRSMSEGKRHEQAPGIEHTLMLDIKSEAGNKKGAMEVVRADARQRKPTMDSSDDEQDENVPPKDFPSFKRTHRVRRSISASAIPNSESGVEERMRVRSPHARSAKHARQAEGKLAMRIPEEKTPSIDPAFLVHARLSTPDKVVSPRSLGPTHILVLHSASNTQNLKHNGRTLHLPINALLFALHAPNLCLRTPNTFPHRLPKALPRVLLRVGRLECWRELIAWMHTRNQAALMRSMIPEWIRDIMHPLPMNAGVGMGLAALTAPTEHTEVADGSVIRRLKPKKSILRFGGLKRSILPSSSQNSVICEMPSLVPQRSLDNIAREIAEAEDAHAVNIDGNAEGNTLVETLIRLNNLQDNLEQVGYYGKELWDEVLTVWNVLAKAVNERAKMDGEGQSEEGENELAR